MRGPVLVPSCGAMRDSRLGKGRFRTGTQPAYKERYRLLSLITPSVRYLLVGYCHGTITSLKSYITI